MFFIGRQIHVDKQVCRKEGKYQENNACMRVKQKNPLYRDIVMQFNR